MHVIILGAGRIAVSLVRWLVSAGHEIAVVEKDQSRCSTLDEELGSISVLGDGTDAGTLARAGANRADVFIATTSRDDVNLVACQIARNRFGVSRTMSVVNTSEHRELFDLLGIDVTIDVTGLVLGRIQESLSSHELVHLMPLSGRDGKTLVAIKVPPEFPVEGRSIKDILLPDGTLITLVITKDGNTSVPDENTLIRAGDDVVAVTAAQEEEELRELIGGTME